VTINTSGSQFAAYQSISYSSFRVNVSTVTSQGTAAAAQKASSQNADSVTLSPQARASTETVTDQTAPVQPSAIPAEHANAATTSATNKSDPAAALFAALDTNQDGSITSDEFTTGAKALLARGRRGGGHAEGAGHGGHNHHGGGRLDSALGRLFSSVDSNGDGTLTKDELSAALARTKDTSTGATTASPTPSDSATSAADTSSTSGSPGASTATFVNVTVVSVAIRSYTSIAQYETTSASSADKTSSKTTDASVTSPTTNAKTSSAA
jgi:hypothetical protein